VVDKFILVEVNKTHRWEDKPLYFWKNKHLFEKFLDKIIYVCPSELPAKPENTYMDWTLENYQRNSIMLGLNGVATDNDLILISDVDEIPNPDRILELKQGSRCLDYDVYSFEQDFFYYYFNFCHTTKWNGTIITKYKNLEKPQEWRNICGLLPEIHNGGWHLSYFGGAKRIGLKICSTVDSAEFQVSSEEIEKRISEGMDIFGRKGREFDIDNVEATNLNIPNITKIFEKYPQFFLQKRGQF